MSKELIEEMREALIHADLKIRSMPGTDQSDVEFIRNILDRPIPSLSHLPDREEVLQEAVKELRMSAVMNCEGNADFLDGIEHAISRIRSLMERKA